MTCGNTSYFANIEFFIGGQINNVICCFGKLDSTTKFKLVKAYCTSYYGCEMWSLWNQNIEDM